MSIPRLLAVPTLLLVFSSGLMAALSAISDRNKHAPAPAYEKWFRGPAPEGVTDLQVAGRWRQRGQPAWFRFKATPAALESVSTAFNPVPFSQQALLAFKPKWDPALREHDPHHRLRWDDIYTAGPLETSERLLYNTAQMWVDRKTNTVYVYCIGD